MAEIKDDNSLEKLRHSAAHLLAAAVMELYPEAKPTIGPAIENGFYYDFDNLKISEEDLPKIEAKMHEIVTSWHKFEKQEVSAAEARKKWKDNPYKLELIAELIKAKEPITFYQSGNFVDLCRGGHVEHPNKQLKYFKLLSVAGAYWRGSEKNKMLTRIYGTAWGSQEALNAYLTQQEEAKKRDHRKIGKTQELFLISQEVGSGLPLYLPKGFIIRRLLEQWLTKEKEKRGYQFVWTPHIAKSSLYKKSGHWQKYDAMFTPMKLDDDDYVVKPMNCPHHFQIFLERPRSYRELPLRIAENATVYRHEKAGELSGLLRVRALTQDDTHTFLRHSQIPQEIDRILELTEMVYKTFGFAHYRARVSTWDPANRQKYLGEPTNWENAQEALIAAVGKRQIPYFIGAGEAAFYGPKIDIMARDAIGREWQLTTVQLDFNQPLNFDMTFVNEKGEQERPAVLHIAILGSLERFLAVLIEHYGGTFPLWLSPLQIVLIPIAERHVAVAEKVKDFLTKAGMRVEIDDRNDTMQAKIRDATLQKVPYMGIIGDKEAASGNVSLRLRNGEERKDVSLESLTRQLQEEIDTKV